MQLIHLPIFFFAIVIHEYAHGWMALRCGDPTAKQSGRLTFNPIPHVDPIGSILVPIMLSLSGMTMFGWAKPVPVNPYFFRDPAWDNVKVSFAGPASNILLSVLLSILIIIFHHLIPNSMYSVKETFMKLLEFGILINLILACFNMIPIPPLDGSHILEYFLPPALAEKYAYFQRYGFILLMLLIFFTPFFRIIYIPVGFMINILYTFINIFI